MMKCLRAHGFLRAVFFQRFPFTFLSVFPFFLFSHRLLHFVMTATVASIKTVEANKTATAQSIF